MGLPSTGELSFLAIRTELGISGAIDLNNSSVRGLAGKASGTISFSDLRGKSSFLNGSASYNVGTIPATTLFTQITIANLSQILSCNFSLTFGGFSRDETTDISKVVPGSLQLKIINASTGAVLASSVVATKNSAVGTVLSAQVSLSTPTNIRLVIEPIAAVSGSGKLWYLFRPKASSCTAIYTYQP